MNDASERIDIVIPVFRGEVAVRRCLESVFASDAARVADIVVVDDASPEPAVSEYLQALAADNKVILLRHEHNQGFVESVNEAAGLHPDRDFVMPIPRWRVIGFSACSIMRGTMMRSPR